MASKFFNYFPDAIFSPLTGENKRVYLDILMNLYHAFFDESADFEDAHLFDSRVRDCIRNTFIDIKVWVDEESGNPVDVMDIPDIGGQVYRIYDRLVSTGWLNVERIGHKNHVFMTPRVIELLEFLESAGGDEIREVGESVLGIYSSLKTIVEGRVTQQDMVAGLRGTERNSRAFARRMNRIAANMRDISERIGEMLLLKDKTNAYFEQFINNTSFIELQDIKSNNHPFRYRWDILALIRKIEHDPEVNQRFIDALRQDSSVDDPAFALNSMLSVVQRIFSNADVMSERIDKNNAKLSKRFADAVRYNRRTRTDTKEKLEQAIQDISKAHPSHLVNLPNRLPYVFAFSEDGLHKPKKARPPVRPPKGVSTKQISSEEAMLSRLRRQYLQDIRVDEAVFHHWLAKLLEGHPKGLSSQDVLIETAPEFAMFIESRRLCSSSHAETSRFKTILKQYDFILTGDELAEHHLLFCRPFLITRTQRV